MIHYELNIQPCFDTEYGKYVSYGVTVCRGSMILRVIEDVSLEKERVESLVRLFNEEGLFPAQLDEAIEDFLIDFSTGL